MNTIESVWYAVAAFDRIVEILFFIALIAAVVLCLRAVDRAFRCSGTPTHRFVHPLGVWTERDRT